MQDRENFWVFQGFETPLMMTPAKQDTLDMVEESMLLTGWNDSTIPTKMVYPNPKILLGSYTIRVTYGCTLLYYQLQL